jgi:hypothetical protein
MATFFPQCDVVKNVWTYVFTSPYVFRARCLIKREDNFEFILLNHGQAITPPEEATSVPVQRQQFKIHETEILLLPSLRAEIRIINQVTYIHVVFLFCLSLFLTYFTTSVTLATERQIAAWLSNAELGKIWHKAAEVRWWRFYLHIRLKAPRKLPNVLSDDTLRSSCYFVRPHSPYGAWGSVVNKALRY